MHVFKPHISLHRVYYSICLYHTVMWRFAPVYIFLLLHIMSDVASY